MSVSCYGVDGSYNEGEDSPRHSPMLTAVRPNFNPRESPPPLQLPQGPTAKVCLSSLKRYLVPLCLERTLSLSILTSDPALDFYDVQNHDAELPDF
jgi:hypothetical protein